MQILNFKYRFKWWLFAQMHNCTSLSTLVLSQCTRFTDRQTERQTDRHAFAIPHVALHAVAR